MKNMKYFVFLIIIVILGCKSEQPAEIFFISHADMGPWNRDVANLKWSIALTEKNITKVQPIQGVEFNTPRVSSNQLNKYLLFEGVKNGEEIIVTIEPGIYDWLIVMDKNNDGRIDSYLGTTKQQIQLDRHEFLEGTRYRVIVHEDTNVEFLIE